MYPEAEADSSLLGLWSSSLGCPLLSTLPPHEAQPEGWGASSSSSVPSCTLRLVMVSSGSEVSCCGHKQFNWNFRIQVLALSCLLVV